jgi:hypothetical protein
MLSAITSSQYARRPAARHATARTNPSTTALVKTRQPQGDGMPEDVEPRLSVKTTGAGVDGVCAIITRSWRIGYAATS